MVNFVCSNLPLNIPDKMDLLRCESTKDRVFNLLKVIHKETQLLELKQNIRSRTREDIDDLRSRIQMLESGVSALNDGEAAMRDEIDNIYRALNALQSLPDPEPIPPVGYQATLDRENNKKE